MNSESLTHGGAYANDPDYDAFQGRIVYRNTIEGITLDGWKVKHTVEYIDLGRADAVTPADPDTEMAPASLSDLPGAKVRRNAVGYTLNRYVDVLRRYGPLPILRIAELTGQTTQSVTTIIKHNAATFIKVGETQGGRGKMAALWGLKGVHDGEALKK